MIVVLDAFVAAEKISVAGVDFDDAADLADSSGETAAVALDRSHNDLVALAAVVFVVVVVVLIKFVFVVVQTNLGDKYYTEVQVQHMGSDLRIE